MRWGALLQISTISVLCAAQSGRVDSLPSGASSEKAGATQTSTPSEPQLPIVVTGRMMGYYRLPDRQPLQFNSADQPCPSDPEKKLSPEAAIFPKKYLRGSGALLLGAGDNFSPNYFSRAFEHVSVPAASTQLSGRLAGKEFFEWDSPNSQWVRYDDDKYPGIDNLRQRLSEGTSTIGTDNVACFFAYAGYAALVPGPEDFYFGPERLRMLARFMAGIEQSGYSKVQMLAANLAIKTTWATDHKPLPDELKPPLPFLTRYVGPTADYSIKVQGFTDAGGVYPWMRKVKIKFEPPPDDWHQEFPKAAFLPRLCRAKTDPDGLMIDPDDLMIVPESHDCKEKIELQQVNVKPEKYKSPSPKNKSEEVEYRIPLAGPLQPGGNYAICIPDPAQTQMAAGGQMKTGARMYCSRFFVYKPFFQTPTEAMGFTKEAESPQGAPAPPAAGTPPATGNSQPGSACDTLPRKAGVIDYRNPAPYALARIGDTPVVIFGVVDPNLATRIGGLNFSWKTMKSDPEKTASDFGTDVIVTDPLKALDQMQQCFAEKNPNFDGLRVLLAHMPPAQATQLAASLPQTPHFDLVISQGDDLLATLPQTITVAKPDVPKSAAKASQNPNPSQTSSPPQSTQPEPDSAAAKPEPSPTPTPLPPRPLVVVPATHSGSQSTIPARELVITSSRPKEQTFTVTAPLVAGNVDDPCGASPFWQAVENAIPGRYARSCETQEDAMKALTLSVMQKNMGADVALLQNRDFYPGALTDYLKDRCPNGCSLLDLQEILDRWIWKGDALIVRSITGAGLQSVLEQSKKYEDEEKAMGDVPHPPGRPLVYVGVHHDDVKDAWIVNTAPLDKNKLYIVAMSDYIALGDTGYPDLAKPPFGDPPRQILSTTHFQTISGAVCQNMEKAAAEVHGLAVHCAPEIRPQDYYDSMQGTPSDPRQGKTKLASLRLWSYFHGQRGEQLTHDQKRVAKDVLRRDIVKKTDEGIQNRPTWQFSLDKLAIGFSGLWHLQDEKTIQQNFGGIRSTQVTAKRFHSWDTEINDQFTRFRTNEDWFVSSSLRYSSKFTANSDPPRTTDQPFDVFSSDAGSYLHLHPFGKQLPQLQWLNSAHFETQPFTPYSSVTINALKPNESSSTLTFVPDRSFLVLGRTGPRWQDRKSYIEAGAEAGSNLDAVTEFDLLNPGGVLILCPLTAKQSLGKCVNNFNKANPTAPITPATTVLTRVATRARYGLFWNSRVQVPFAPQLGYEMKNSGDYFFNSGGDNSTDVRFRHTLDQTVKFSVFPNLSFEPTYTIFLFENKVDYHFLFQQQFSIKINYAFVWNSNRDKKQQWGYKAPSDGK